MSENVEELKNKEKLNLEKDKDFNEIKNEDQKDIPKENELNLEKRDDISLKIDKLFEGELTNEKIKVLKIE